MDTDRRWARAGVQLVAAAGSAEEWYPLANDTNAGNVRVVHLVWPP